MGTEEFWVPAVLAAVSAGGQYINQSNANKRQQNAEVQSITDQQKLRDQANSQVKALTSQVASNNPNQLASQAEGSYINQLRKNAAGSTQGGSTSDSPTTFGASTSALPPVAGADPRYAAGLKQSQADVQNYGTTYAKEMAGIDSAIRQRQNEGLGMQTLGTNLNTLGATSYTQNFVDQLRAQAGGTQNPWATLGSNIVGNYANYMSKNPSDPNAPPQTLVSNKYSGQ